MTDEPVKTVEKKPDEAPKLDGVPPEAQKFADDIVQSIIKKLPSPPPTGSPGPTENAEQLRFLVEQVKAIATNQYCDHLILEAIWGEIGMTTEQARQIDRKVAEEQSRKKGK